MEIAAELKIQDGRSALAWNGSPPSAEEAVQIAALRADLGDALKPSASGGAPFEENTSTFKLLRFVRGHAENAAEAYRATLVYREEVQADAARAQLLSLNWPWPTVLPRFAPLVAVIERGLRMCAPCQLKVAGAGETALLVTACDVGLHNLKAVVAAGLSEMYLEHSMW